MRSAVAVTALEIMATTTVYLFWPKGAHAALQSLWPESDSI